jgi:hypothetical protein
MKVRAMDVLLPARRHRRAAALVSIVVLLAVIAAIMATTAWQITASRRLLTLREQELQAAWLARAGVEMAVARLLSHPASYRGETVEIIAHSEVRIRVQPEPGALKDFRLASEARYPTDVPRPTVHSVTCEVQRVVTKSKTSVKVRTFDVR